MEHNLARLEAYLKEPAPYSIVVLVAPYEKLDERKKVTKALKKNAALFEAKKLTEADLKKWIITRAEYNGVVIEPKAVELILTLVGTNLFMLTSEIDKMALYIGQAHVIDVKTVESLVARSLEQNIFTLVDKIVERKIEYALRIYYDLLTLNEEPIKILAVITNANSSNLSSEGISQKRIWTKTNCWSFKGASISCKVSCRTSTKICRKRINQSDQTISRCRL